MTTEERFVATIQDNLQKEKASFPSVVQGVVMEAGETFCKVKLTHNDLEVEEVLYSATEENAKGFILIPKEGTNVLVGTMGDDENSLYLVRMDEVAKVQVVIEEERITIDSTGINVEFSDGKVTVKNKNADLKTLMNDLVDMVTGLTVSTGVGPSGTPLPPTVMKAETIKDTIKALFK